MQPPVPSAENSAVFLDFDGTLVDFAATPEAVVVPPELQTLLQSLSGALEGALALVTGRSLESLDSLIGHKRLCAAGCHGAEWRLAGIESSVDEGGATLREARTALNTFAEHHGLLLEDKPFSLALHFRDSPEKESVIDQWLMDNLTQSVDLRIINGKSVREVQLAGVDKGSAVERFMAHPPFMHRKPIYIGDDVTDEDAFAWVNEAGGLSIKVGQGDTIAPYRLADQSAVAAWLKAMLSAR